jgi:3-oxosteroid 1-dehydrogenase
MADVVGAWDAEVDVLIVGSGAAAMTAAVVARKNHADVLVLEKSELYGGSSATSGGVVWIPATRQALAAGSDDTPQDGFNYIRALTAPEVPDSLIWAFVNNGPKMLDWMEENSEVKYVTTHYCDYHPNLPGGKTAFRSHDAVPIHASALGDDFLKQRAQHPAAQFFGKINWTVDETTPLLFRLPGWKKIVARLFFRYYLDLPWRFRSKRDRFLTLGSALAARLKLSMDKVGAKLWLKTKFLELVTENGKVVGALVEKEGRRMRIGARQGVLLAAGGFERNPEMRSKYLPVPTIYTGAQPPNTGDAIRAAMDMGAQTARMNSAWWGVSLAIPGEDKTRLMTFERALPGCIVVNQAGKRYFNEAASYHIAGHAMIDNNKPGAATVPSYILFDSQYRHDYPMGPVLPLLPDWMLSANIKQVLIKGNSWEDVARRAGLPWGPLKQTIENFNTNAKLGKDPEFLRGDDPYDCYYGDPKVKPNPTLRALDKGPFYAFPVYPGDIGTNGGLVIDENARVIGKDGNPIPGLYAAGNTTASVMGYSYPAAGATLGPAMTFGYLAARHMVGVNA